ncbi:MAG: hypothetical protein ACYC1E_18335 [Propionibacteriaceae bacterium]
MEIRHQRFVRSALTPADSAELERVDALAVQLREHLESREAEIDLVHIHRAQSSAVQLIVSSLLKEHLGFREEVVLTPSDGFVTHARPDFVYALGPGRGILAEVERGGTTTNNHDLKDLWKTHIAPDAQHLFLVVPNANWNEAGAAREHPYARVLLRLGSFFGDPRREIDVVSLHVFGYGRATSPPPPVARDG